MLAERRWVWAACFVLGLSYAFVVPSGLPYDEPSHWATVLYYSKHWTLPVLGHPYVSYEGQMGPVAYYLDAIFVHLTSAFGGGANAQLHVVRVVGVVELVALVMVIAKLLDRLGIGQRASLSAVIVFAANPMLLAMSASVQNDTLALVLALLYLERILAWSEVMTTRRAIWGGVLAGLAILTKLTVWPAAAVGLVWTLVRAGSLKAAAMCTGLIAVCGWWLIRNQVIYGDITARNAVHRTGVSFAPYRAGGLGGIAHIAEEVVTYLWLPTEYFRNLIAAPSVLKALLVVVTLAICAFGSRELLGWRRLVVTGTAGLAVAIWVVTFVGVQAVAFRTAYVALPAWGLMIAGAARRIRYSVPATVALMACLNIWTLTEIARVSWPLLV